MNTFAANPTIPHPYAVPYTRTKISPATRRIEDPGTGQAALKFNRLSSETPTVRSRGGNTFLKAASKCNMRKRIILIEDDAEDVKLISKVVGQTSPDCSLEVFRDGMNALQFFERYGSGPNNLPISLVLLDLKLPQLDGIDLLRAIKRSTLTRHLPVVVVTGTASPEQISGVYQIGANSVIEKQPTRTQAEKSLRSTLDFWLNNNLAAKAIGTI